MNELNFTGGTEKVPERGGENRKDSWNIGPAWTQNGWLSRKEKDWGTTAGKQRRTSAAANQDQKHLQTIFQTSESSQHSENGSQWSWTWCKQRKKRGSSRSASSRSWGYLTVSKKKAGPKGGEGWSARTISQIGERGKSALVQDKLPARRRTCFYQPIRGGNGKKVKMWRRGVGCLAEDTQKNLLEQKEWE